jgi:hypothetical protein
MTDRFLHGVMPLQAIQDLPLGLDLFVFTQPIMAVSLLLKMMVLL